MSKCVIINNDGLMLWIGGSFPKIITKDTPGYSDITRYCLECSDPSLEIIDQLIGGASRARIPKVLSKATDLFEYTPAGVGVVGIPSVLDSQVLTAIATDVAENPDNLDNYRKFFERSKANPDINAVRGLFGWIVKSKLSILPDGRFVAYKGVSSTYFDIHTGTIKNTPGTYIEMPRDKVDADENHTCSYGLNIANYSFADNYGSLCLRVLVDPVDVVCVPVDNVGKIRVCRYYVDREVSSDSLDDLDSVVSADATKVEPEEAKKIEASHSRWSPKQIQLLTKVAKKYLNHKGKTDWKRVSDVLGRTEESCSRQYRRVMRGK